MSTLVTGGRGFVGRHLVDQLLADGAKVIAYTDPKLAATSSTHLLKLAEDWGIKDEVMRKAVLATGGNDAADKVADGQASANQGQAENPNLTLLATAEDYVKIALGQMDGTAAFMQGKLKIKGDMGLAIKFSSLFKRPT